MLIYNTKEAYLREAIEYLLKKKLSRTPRNNNIKCALIKHCALGPPFTMIRKSILKNNNIYYEDEFSLDEDYRLWTWLISYTDSYRIPKVLVYYREHKTNISKTHKEEVDFTQIKVHSYMKAEHTKLYHEFMLKAPKVSYICFFEVILLLKIVKPKYFIRLYLFDKILLFSRLKFYMLEEKS